MSGTHGGHSVPYSQPAAIRSTTRQSALFVPVLVSDETVENPGVKVRRLRKSRRKFLSVAIHSYVSSPGCRVAQVR